jgi:hypothetical protein
MSLGGCSSSSRGSREREEHAPAIEALGKGPPGSPPLRRRTLTPRDLSGRPER